MEYFQSLLCIDDSPIGHSTAITDLNEDTDNESENDLGCYPITWSSTECTDDEPGKFNRPVSHTKN